MKSISELVDNSTKFQNSGSKICEIKVIKKIRDFNTFL